MGFINKLFGAGNDSKPKKDAKQLPWNELTSVSQLDEIEKRSKAKTQFIFKHSTRCGISRMVMNQFVSTYDLDLSADLYYLDLLSFRDVSDEVGYKFQVLHQSPQLIVVRNGQTVAHASHGAINDMELQKFE